MRIERVEVMGFGCLRRVELRLEPGRANLVLARNEAGKSTLLAAIETGLYGFPAARRAEGREARQRYRPWEGGASRVVLELGDAGGRYAIEQELLDASGNAVERGRVWRDGVEVTDEMEAAGGVPGVWLLGLTRDDFARSVMVRQGELELVARDTQELVRQLDALVTSTEAGASASAAQARLAEALEQYRVLAGLEHWSQDALARAVQWPRVEARLWDQIARGERDLAALRARREALTGEIERLDAARERGAVWREAREKLRWLARRAQRGELEQALAADDRLAGEVAELQERVEACADVAAFPAERAGDFNRLLEREAQLRGSWDGVRRAVAELERDVTVQVGQLSAAGGARELAGRVESLAEARVLYQKDVAELGGLVQEEEAAREALAVAGCPVAELEAARALYAVLDGEERRRVVEFERRQLEAAREREAIDAERRVLEAEMRAIGDARRRLRVVGVVLAGGGFVGGAGAVVGLLIGGAGALVAALAGAGVVVLLGGLGTWTLVRSGRFGARALEALREQLDAVARRGAEREAVERAEVDRLRASAERLAVSPRGLVESVRLYMAHRDVLQDQERVARRRAEVERAVREHEQRWEAWWRAVEPEAGGDVSVAGAEGLVRRLKGVAEVEERYARDRERLDALRAEVEQRRRGLEAVQRELTVLLEAAGMEAPAEDPVDGLVPGAEWVVARGEFQRRAARFAERGRMVTELEAKARHRLNAERRAALEARVAALRGEGDGAADQESSAAVLDWLHAHADALEDIDWAAWEVHALASEEVDRAVEVLGRRIDAAQAAETGTWQEARSFLREYVPRARALEGQLRQLRAELERGQRFAAAITIAQRELDEVQGDSFQRWSLMLQDALRPLLEELLPDYALEAVGSDLSPVLTVRATGRRLDLPAIMLHMSRGAKDRLYLALRLAVARVLRGAREEGLPVLLDDPLANWDDAALARGLAELGRLGRGGVSVVVFTCQEARCAAVVDGLAGTAAAWAVRSLEVAEVSERA